MDGDATHRPEAAEDAHHHVRGVARGGALNLFGSVVYGAANFILLAVITNELGATRAGPLIVAIAVFTIVSRVSELGASTGLVRMISRERALGRVEHIVPTLAVAVLPVLLLGAAFSVLVWVLAPDLAALFGKGEDETSITDLLRVLAPFVPIVAAYTVLVQGTRGFGVMWPLVWIEKVLRAVAMPVAAFAVLRLGGSAEAVLYAWVLTSVVAGVLAVVAIAWLTGRERRGAADPDDAPPAIAWPSLARGFWAFALPRALGQSFDVAVLWFDTLFVAALIGATDAGIYAAGTRYLLIGTFVTEAIQQAIAPKVSSLLTVRKTREAREVVGQATTWAAAIIWPTYLVVAAFSAVLLAVFGPSYVRAQGALVLLALGMLLASTCGPSDSVILMSGRSRHSMFNSAAALVVNVAGNLLLVPRYGITAAGGVWALTLIVGAGLPALQSVMKLGIVPWSASLANVMVIALGTVGAASALALIALGDTVAGLVAAVLVGGPAYLAFSWIRRRSIYSAALLDGFRRRRRVLSASRASSPTEPPVEESDVA